MLGVVLFVGMVLLTAQLWRTTPGSLVPDEDQGFYIAAVMLPDGATLERTDAVVAEVPVLLGVHESHASLHDRLVGTGMLTPDLAARFAAGGVVRRASARRFDARVSPGYAPYDMLVPVVATQAGGDVEARVRVGIEEVGTSIALVRRLLAALPEGETLVPLPSQAGEGAALVEGFRGECMHWMRLDQGGLIRAVFLRDPSWLHWPLLEAAVEGNIVADFPLINKSFNASYSGVDL